MTSQAAGWAKSKSFGLTGTGASHLDRITQFGCHGMWLFVEMTQLMQEGHNNTFQFFERLKEKRLSC